MFEIKKKYILERTTEQKITWTTQLNALLTQVPEYRKTVTVVLSQITRSLVFNKYFQQTKTRLHNHLGFPRNIQSIEWLFHTFSNLPDDSFYWVTCKRPHSSQQFEPNPSKQREETLIFITFTFTFSLINTQLKSSKPSTG